MRLQFQMLTMFTSKKIKTSNQFKNIKFNFKNKDIIVIGGSRGIGEECVNFFTNISKKITYSSRKKNYKFKKKVKYIYADVRSENSIKKLFSKIKKIDILIFNSGIFYSNNLEKISIKEWDNVLNTNLRGFYLCIKYALPILKKNQSSSVVNISSIAGKKNSLTAGSHYVASKHGLIGLTKQYANELAKYNVRVNSVCPSQTETKSFLKIITKQKLSNLQNKIPLKRLAKIKDIIGPIAFLSSDLSAYITGSTIDVNGGQL